MKTTRLLVCLCCLAFSLNAEAKVDSAVAKGGMECEIFETKGRQRERYSLRFEFPDAKGEFALRLYPLVVGGIISSGLGSDGSAPNVSLQLLDNQIPEAETLEDLILAQAEGRTVVKLFSKLSGERLHSVKIDCRPEIELRGTL